jgi:hypothetical protein
MEAEFDKCRRSLVIQNPSKWVEADRSTEGFLLADRVTAAIHRATRGMVSITDAFQIGPMRQGQAGGGPPPAVHITFASGSQKGCWFKVLASMSRAGGQATEMARDISCRDSFPKGHLATVKELASKGMALKRGGKVGSYRVKAQGPACISVLEVRATGHRGPGGWQVYIPTAREKADSYAERVRSSWDRLSPQERTAATSTYRQKVQESVEEGRRLQEQQEAARREREQRAAALAMAANGMAAQGPRAPPREPDYSLMSFEMEGQAGAVHTY